MAEIREYVLIDVEGYEASDPTRDLEIARQHRRVLGPERHAIAAVVYEYTHEEPIEIPEGHAEWPPDAAAQEESGRRYVTS